MSISFFCYGVIIHHPLPRLSSMNPIVTAVLRFPFARSAADPVKTKLTVVKFAAPSRQSGVDMNSRICRSRLLPGASCISDVANVGTFDWRAQFLPNLCSWDKSEPFRQPPNLDDFCTSTFGAKLWLLSSWFWKMSKKANLDIHFHQTEFLARLMHLSKVMDFFNDSRRETVTSRSFVFRAIFKNQIDFFFSEEPGHQRVMKEKKK